VLQRGNYTAFAWTCAVIVALSGLIAVGAVHRERARLHGPKTREAPLFATLAREMIDLARNGSFLALFGTVLIYFLAYGTAGALALHAGRYFWGLDTSAIHLVLLSATLGPLLGAPPTAFALRPIGKRT